MTPFTRTGVLVALALALCIGTACSEPTAPSGALITPAASASQSPPGSPSKLGAEVQMPVGFPSDFPIYPGSRLTQAGKFAGTGTTNWGMEWQTLDGAAKVQSFFVTRLGSGDWALPTRSGTATSFSASFRRKSDPTTNGTLGANVNGGVTRISVVLTTSP
jgi:hypothetical protein